MGNATPEQDLVNKFQYILENNSYIDNTVLRNFNCRAKKYADVEFLNNDGEYLVLEAKTHQSDDKHNTYHKVFGELMKDTGRVSENRTKHKEMIKRGILIPIDDDGRKFYLEHFRNIPRNIFIQFGEMTNSVYIYTCSSMNNIVEMFKWIDFYDKKEPIRVFAL